MTITGRTLLLTAGLLLGPGCAGELELAASAYQQKSGGEGGAGGGAGAPMGAITPSNSPSVSGDPTDAAAGGKADAPWGPDAGAMAAQPGNKPDAWAAPAETSTPPPQPLDAGPPPTVSACPPGVDPLGLLATKCGACHGERNPAKALDLITAGAGARLVGVKSTCQGRPLLDPAPGAPKGHFLDKLAGPVAGCGAQMPYGTPALSGPERDCLVEWSAKAIARALPQR